MAVEAMAKYMLPILIATGLAGFSLLAMADDHSEHVQASGQTSAPLVISKHTPFAKLMDQSMAIMHQGMATAPATGDPDHDFAAMMIPHHQGAVDMAKIRIALRHKPCAATPCPRNHRYAEL